MGDQEVARQRHEPGLSHPWVRAHRHCRFLPARPQPSVAPQPLEVPGLTQQASPPICPAPQSPGHPQVPGGASSRSALRGIRPTGPWSRAPMQCPSSGGAMHRCIPVTDGSFPAAGGPPFSPSPAGSVRTPHRGQALNPQFPEHVTPSAPPECPLSPRIYPQPLSPLPAGGRRHGRIHRPRPAVGPGGGGQASLGACLPASGPPAAARLPGAGPAAGGEPLGH